MTIWIDAQLSPDLATWIAEHFQIEATAVRDLGLRDTKDIEIFHAARAADAILMTKDSDFVDLLERLGPPPRVLWVTCGNTSNARLKGILFAALPTALRLLEQGHSSRSVRPRSEGCGKVWGGRGGITGDWRRSGSRAIPPSRAPT